MSILNNLKHEAFANKVCEDSTVTRTQAYKEVYPAASHVTAKQNSSQLYKRKDIKARVAQILSENKLTSIESTIGRISKRAVGAKKALVVSGEVVLVDDESLRNKCDDTLLNLHGATQTSNTSNVDARSVSITVNNEDSKHLSNICDTLEAMNAKLNGDNDLQSGEIVDI
jgi:hypothetical protein